MSVRLSGSMKAANISVAFSFVRLYDTQEYVSEDYLITDGETLIVNWAYGNVSGGAELYHTTAQRGSTTFSLIDMSAIDTWVVDSTSSEADSDSFVSDSGMCLRGSIFGLVLALLCLIVS